MQVGGDEDLPEGCVAVVARQGMDVLCHAAVRARATGALVVCCTDAALVDAFAADCCGEYARLTLNGNALEWRVTTRAESEASDGASDSETRSGGQPVRLKAMADAKKRCAALAATAAVLL